MRTRQLLRTMFVALLVLVLSMVMGIMAVVYVPGGNVRIVLFAIVWFFVLSSGYRIIKNFIVFIREKHLIVLNHKIAAVKKIWYLQRWVLLAADTNSLNANDLQLNIHFSNEITPETMATMVQIAANGAHTFSASVAAEGLMKDSGIKHQDN